MTLLSCQIEFSDDHKREDRRVAPFSCLRVKVAADAAATPAVDDDDVMTMPLQGNKRHTLIRSHTFTVHEFRFKCQEKQKDRNEREEEGGGSLSRSKDVGVASILSSFAGFLFFGKKKRRFVCVWKQDAEWEDVVNVLVSGGRGSSEIIG